MISAEEARRIANNIENKKNSEQLTKIENAIMKEAKEGSRGVSINFWPCLSIQELLNNQGYSFETFSERNEQWTNITW